MPRTTLTPTVLTRAGVHSNGGAFDVANGMDFVNDGTHYLWLYNGDSVTRIVDVTAGEGLVFDGTPQDFYRLSVPVAFSQLHGPFPPRLYNQGNGRVLLDCASTLVTIVLFRLPY